MLALLTAINKHKERFVAMAFSLSSKHIFLIKQIVLLLIGLKMMYFMELFVVKHHRIHRKWHIRDSNNLSTKNCFFNFSSF
jgi:hypothetical protein